MAYEITGIDSTSLISNSQPVIKENFIQLNTQFTVDHTALTAASNNGKHTQINFPAVTAQGAQAGAASVVYSKSDGTSTQLWFKNAARDTQITPQIPLFAAINYTIAGGAITTTNFTYFATSSRNATGKYRTTFTSTYGSIFYLQHISFLTANGASRVTITDKQNTYIEYEFQDVNNAYQDPAQVTVMVWKGV